MVSRSLERYPIPTHNSSYFISSKFSSFPVFELLVETIGSLVFYHNFGNSSPTRVLVALLGLSSEDLL